MKLATFRASPLLAGIAFVLVGCRGILGIEDPIECSNDDACNVEGEPCVLGECVDGACAFSVREEGFLIDNASEFDCKKNVCDGNGGVVTVADAADAPADATPEDCQAPACNEAGEVVQAPADDPPAADATAGDCQGPICQDGAVAQGPTDDPPADEVEGDCQAPACDAGEVVSAADDDDVPEDDDAGDCQSPACDGGEPTSEANDEDVPTDTSGDCLAAACTDGAIAADDDDVPAECGSCDEGVVVPWAEVGNTCYTGAPTDLTNQTAQGICASGLWECVAEEKVCANQVLPRSETCTSPNNDEDCDGTNDEDGGGCACQLNDVVSCYTGPANTQDVGTCEAGTQTCVDTGNGFAFGACTGQTLPEACDLCLPSNQDEDCSGTAATCSGAYQWAVDFGNATSDSGRAVAFAPDGDVVLGGTFSDTLTVAGQNLVSDGGVDMALVRMDGSGNVQARIDYGGAGTDSVIDVLFSPTSMFVVGNLGSGTSENFGGGTTLTTEGGLDGYIARFPQSFTTTFPAATWVRRLGGVNSDSISDSAVTSNGGVVVVGSFAGTANINGTNVVSSSATDFDVFLASLDSSGNNVFTPIRWGGTDVEVAQQIAVGPNDEIVAVGQFRSASLAFGNGVTLTAASAGNYDAYVVKFNSAGVAQWARRLSSPGTSADYAYGVGVLSNGDVVVSGITQGALDLNGSSGAEVTSDGDYDGYLARYNASGTYQTSRHLQSTSTSALSGLQISVAPDDGIILAGGFFDSVYLGDFLFFNGNTILLSTSSQGGRDIFMAKYTPGTGFPMLWSERYGGTSSESFPYTAVQACGDILLTTGYQGTANFGPGNMTSAGSYDTVVARYRQ